MRIALVVMPFAAEDRPALGPSLLKSILTARGHACEVLYFNLAFAAEIGLDFYRLVDREPARLVGERLYRSSRFPAASGPGLAEYRAQVLAGARLPDEFLDALPELERRAERFLDSCLDAAPWGGYDVVGFSSSFQQNLASLSLARRLKEEHRCRVILGGANAEGEMAAALLEHFPELDAVLAGEADESLPALVEAYALGATGAGIPGVLVRGAATQPARLPDPTHLPPPDYDDYFSALRASGLSLAPSATHLPMEWSRGCLRQGRNACAFCGLNGEHAAYRRKSAERVRDELIAMERHPTRSVLVSDNLVTPDAAREILTSAPSGWRFFLEVRPEWEPADLDRLRAGGVRRVQAGIESLAPSALARMRKGMRACDGIAFLREAVSRDIAVTWNLLVGFPGETEEERALLASLVPLLHHLPPPAGLFRVQVERFSAYHADPAAFGLVGVRPATAYAHVYPLPPDAVRRLAYYFETDEESSPTLERLGELVNEWRLLAGRGAAALAAIDDGRRVAILDRRDPNAEQRWTFEAHERALLLACRRPQSIDRLALPLAAMNCLCEEEELVATRQGMEEKGLLVELDGFCCGLSAIEPLEPGDEIERALETAATLQAARLAALTRVAG